MSRPSDHNRRSSFPTCDATARHRLEVTHKAHSPDCSCSPLPHRNEQFTVADTPCIRISIPLVIETMNLRHWPDPRSSRIQRPKVGSHSRHLGMVAVSSVFVASHNKVICGQNIKNLSGASWVWGSKSAHH